MKNYFFIFYVSYSISLVSMNTEDYKKLYPVCWFAIHSNLISLLLFIDQLERKTIYFCSDIALELSKDKKNSTEVKQLIKNGTTAMIRTLVLESDHTNNTPLSIAIMNNNIPFFNYIVTYLPHIDYPIFQDLTPLLLICLIGNNTLLKPILNLKPNINQQTKNGMTSLHLILLNILKSINNKWNLTKSHSMINLLLAHQADPLQKNNEQVSSIQLLMNIKEQLPKLVPDKYEYYYHVKATLDTIQIHFNENPFFMI